VYDLPPAVAVATYFWIGKPFACDAVQETTIPESIANVVTLLGGLADPTT
jgi:hypothetical protein